MAEFASKGVAGAGLGTGIAGLALGVLNSSNNGNGVLACLVPTTDGKIKSNEFKFRTINMDESSATKTRTFKVYINVTAEISNTNFGLGNMFPRSK
jgi:hypothetical protein